MPDPFHEILTSSGFRNYQINSEALPTDGLVFCYPSWSSSYIILATVLKCLEQYTPTPILYIYDIDTTAYKLLAHHYGFISHGKGELLFLKDGMIIAAIEQYKGDITGEIQLFLATALQQ